MDSDYQRLWVLFVIIIIMRMCMSIDLFCAAQGRTLLSVRRDAGIFLKCLAGGVSSA